MKKLKKIICGFLVMVMSVTLLFAADSQTALAAGSVYVNSDVRCGVGMRYSSAIKVSLVDTNDTIKNIKVYQGKKKTNNLVVKLTEKNTGSYSPYAYLTIYAKKAGTYKIKFDVYKSSKRKRTSRTVRVHAQGYNSVISSVKLNGKNIIKSSSDTYSAYVSNKSAKVKFGLSNGYKIKKITVSYRDQNGREKTKNFKNGKKLNLGNYGYSYDNNNYWQKGMWAYTKFTITYKDKYAQDVNYNEGTVTYYIYKKATKWY